MCLNKHDCLLNRLPWGAHAAFRLHMVLGWWTYLLRELRGLLSHLPRGGGVLKCAACSHMLSTVQFVTASVPPQWKSMLH